ncbi:hypothetical protein T459_10487 [Capsicum annuum]|uniref:Fe2OG dioxygenase domain-containing protein n=1 Tax=Capsicum annuum TaxID=4072 RepID=A0A2G3A2G9_CAPAN|nr:hypothetical protein T459_10487 [Capsicum annuum]
MASFDIPTIDFSPLFSTDENNQEKKQAMEQIGEACVNYGFFQITSHGIPLELLSRTMDMYETFFACSDEEKLSLPHNYMKSKQNSAETWEHLVFNFSSSGFDFCPDNPPHFKQVLEEMASHFTKLGVLLEGIISECLGLPPDFLANYKSDRSPNSLMGLHYFPATEDENTGKPAHEDPGCFTIVYQDELGGLQVQKDDQWIPIAPCKDKLVVNIGDVIQLLGWLVATLFILAGVYVLLLRRFTMLVRKFSSSVPSSSRRVVPSSPKKAIPTSPKMIVQLLTEVWITVMNV